MSKAAPFLPAGTGAAGADSEHIVGELLKGFLKKRPLSPDMARRINGLAGKDIAGRLQQGLGAVSLVSFSAAQTAIINDLGADLMYAQQLTGLCKKGDVVIGISTSGNADNVRPMPFAWQRRWVRLPSP